MKKTVAVACTLMSMMAFSTVAFGQRYECYRYVDGHPTGSFVNITADTKEEATIKAMKKLKKLGGRVTSTNCKIKI